MAWKRRPSGKRYLYISRWDRVTQQTVTRYIPIAEVEQMTKAASRDFEQPAERRALACKTQAAPIAVRLLRSGRSAAIASGSSRRWPRLGRSRCRGTHRSAAAAGRGSAAARAGTADHELA
jgi:hypothetical protein